MSSVSDNSCQLVLYVKAGADGKRYGACPFCQRAFMVLMIKSLHHSLHFRTVNVNLARPPTEFCKKGLRRLPALEDEEADHVVDNVEDIVTYLEQKWPDSRLAYDNPAADLAVKDIFSRFCFYIKQVSKDPTQLESQLQQLDSFLAKEQRGMFLCGDRLCHLDCEFLPKLQHIRVASSALKNFQISVRLTHLWAYLFAAYNSDVFVRTCPSDQEILLHWLDRPEMEHMDYGQHKKLVHEKPRFSLDVPVVAAMVNVE